MQLDDRQYERVQQWLEGQNVELSDAQRQAAEELQQDQQRLGRLLDVPMPAQALQRARRRMVAELARPRFNWRRWAVPVGGALAAAAALVLAVTVFWPTPSQPLPGPGIDTRALVEQVAITPDAVTGSYKVSSEWAQLDAQLEALEADVLASSSGKVDADLIQMGAWLGGSGKPGEM